MTLFCWCVNVVGFTAARTYQDKELHARIPERLKRQVEELVKRKLNEVITLHYDVADDIISTSRDPSLSIKDEVHRRSRRGKFAFICTRRALKVSSLSGNKQGYVISITLLIDRYILT